MSTAENTPRKTPKPVLTRGQIWWRRIRRTIIALLVLLLVARLALTLILPSAIRKAGEYYGLRTEYGRAKLGLLGGYAAIWDVRITPAEGGEAVATADFCEAAISPWALLRGKLIVWRVGADGVTANVERLADGRVPLLEKFASPPAKVAPAPAGEKRELDLAAPLQVEAFRLSNVSAHLRDLSVTPPFDAVIRTSIRVSDIGNENRPASVDITVQSAGILEDLRLSGTAQSRGREVNAELNMIGRGLSLQQLAGYLAPLGFAAHGRPLDLTGQMTIATTAVEGTLDALKGEATFNSIRLHDGERDALRIATIKLSPSYIGPDRLDLGKMEIADVTVEASRTQDSRLAFGPVEMTGPAPTSAPATQAAIAPATTRPVALPNVSLDELEIRNVSLGLTDNAIPGTARLSLVLDELKLANLATQTRGESKPVTISARLNAPGIARQITIDGEAHPLDERKTAHLSVRVAGIRPDAAKPYLDASALRSEYQNGVLSMEVAASFTEARPGILQGDITLQDLSLTDSQTLLKLADSRITDCQIDRATGAVRVGAIDISGPKLSAHRSADGTFSLLGLSTVPGATPIEAPAKAPPAGAAANFPLPKLTIDRFTWKDIRFDFADDFVKPAARLAMTDAGLEIRDLVLDPAATGEAKPASIRAWMKVPGIIDDAGSTGELAIAPQALRLSAKSAARGISPGGLSPYLEPAGIVPLLADGLFQSTEQFTLRPIPGGYAIDLSLADIKLSEGQTPLASLAKLAVRDAKLTGAKTLVSGIEIEQPFIAIARDRNGLLQLAGVRLEPRPSEPAPLALPELPLVGVDHLAVKGARVSWTDHGFEPAIATTSTTDIELTGLRLSEPADPARLQIRTALEGAVKSITVDAAMSTPPGRIEMKSRVGLSGIALGPLAGYLPAGMSDAMRDGQLNLALATDLSARPAGGIAAEVAVSDFALSDSGKPLVSFERGAIVAPALDPDHLEISLDELALAGCA